MGVGQMTEEPYPAWWTPAAPHLLDDGSGDVICEYQFADTPNGAAQQEVLTIRTRISPPIPDDPRALSLVALLHVQELIRRQIEAMRPARLDLNLKK